MYQYKRISTNVLFMTAQTLLHAVMQTCHVTAVSLVDEV